MKIIEGDFEGVVKQQFMESGYRHMYYVQATYTKEGDDSITQGFFHIMTDEEDRQQILDSIESEYGIRLHKDPSDVKKIKDVNIRESLFDAPESIAIQRTLTNLGNTQSYGDYAVLCYGSFIDYNPDIEGTSVAFANATEDTLESVIGEVLQKEKLAPHNLSVYVRKGDEWEQCFHEEYI
jgi:hypothetical protein